MSYYYQKEFDKRGFDTIFTLLEMGKPKINIPVYEKAIQDLVMIMTQKTAGQRKNNRKDINWEENFDMTIITIVVESIALYLSGALDKLKRKENKMSKNYKLKSGNYIKIDMTDEGYQYYLYEENKKLIDGGILENSKLNDKETLEEVLKILNIPIDIQYQELEEEIEES